MQGFREASEKRLTVDSGREREGNPRLVRKLRRMRDRGRPDGRVSNWKGMAYTRLFLERVRISLIAKEF